MVSNQNRYKQCHESGGSTDFAHESSCVVVDGRSLAVPAIHIDLDLLLVVGELVIRQLFDALLLILVLLQYLRFVHHDIVDWIVAIEVVCTLDFLNGLKWWRLHTW